MRRIMIVGFSLISLAHILLFACGGDPAGVTSPITVTTPASSTIWEHYQSNSTIEWNGGSTDNLSIKLLKSGEAVTTLASAAPNSGTYILSERVSPYWGTGTDFTIRIEDGLGEVGNSSQFEIAVSSGEEIIQVTNPTSSTQWQHYEEDLTISWYYPSAKSAETTSRIDEVSTTRSTGTLSGDSVDIELYQGEDFIATLGSGVSSTAGSYTYAGPVPLTWGTGTDFKVRVVDDLGNYGFSSEFSITESSGQEVITVTEPTSSTEWEYEQTGTTVNWEYPDKGNSDTAIQSRLMSHSSSGTDSDNVRIEIWHDGVKIDDFSGWVSNTGSYTRNDPLPSSWCGFDYQIKVIDEDDNYGSSENFTIAEPSGEEIITVTEPNSSTEWEYEQTETTVEWSFPYSGGSENRNIRSADNARHETDADSVRIELWYQGSKVADYSGWIANTGNYTRVDPLSSSWCGSDYQIKVIDSNNNYGSSENFTIAEPSGEEIIAVIEPNSSTEWEYEQMETTVEWSFPYSGDSGNRSIRFADIASSGTDSDNVRIEIWHDGVKIDDFSGWVSNTGSYTRNDPLPSSWGTGFNFQIKIIDESDNYGISESFLISGSIDVTTPDASTVWEIGETNTQAVWNGGGDQVKLEVWYAGVYVDDYSGWIDNNGNYTRSAPIPTSWSIGEHFRIRVVEPEPSQNDGYSDEFQIFDEVNVTQPNSGTMWAWGEEGVTVQWSENYSDSVYINVYRGGSYFASFSSWVPNTGSYTRTSSVPSSWGTGEDFQIKVTGSLGSTGLSEEFSIWAIDITEPNSSTEWYCDQTNTEVHWELAPGSIVRMEIWQNGSKIDDYCGWTDNDGEYTRAAAIPGTWGEGENYTLNMIDDLNNVGWSEEFSIEDFPLEGLVAYYPLNGNANDESGNAHHGEVVGLVNFNTPDRFGNPNSAIDIPDDWSYIRIENHPDLEVQSHTISAWVKHDSGGDNGGIFNNGNQRDHYSLRTASGSIIHVINYPDTGCDHIYNTDVLADNNWHHLLVTYDDYTSCIWIDGNMISNHVFNKTITYNIHERSYIGMNFPGGWDWFEGCIDDIRLFNRTLSETEIQAIYHEGGW